VRVDAVQVVEGAVAAVTAAVDRHSRVSGLGGFHVVVPILFQIPVTAGRPSFATLA
jgi:hypothetical protein